MFEMPDYIMEGLVPRIIEFLGTTLILLNKYWKSYQNWLSF